MSATTSTLLLAANSDSEFLVDIRADFKMPIETTGIVTGWYNGRIACLFNLHGRSPAHIDYTSDSVGLLLPSTLQLDLSSDIDYDALRASVLNQLGLSASGLIMSADRHRLIESESGIVRFELPEGKEIYRFSSNRFMIRYVVSEITERSYVVDRGTSEVILLPVAVSETSQASLANWTWVTDDILMAVVGIFHENCHGEFHSNCYDSEMESRLYAFDVRSHVFKNVELPNELDGKVFLIKASDRNGHALLSTDDNQSWKWIVVRLIDNDS